MYQRQGKAAYKADLSNTLRICEILQNPEAKFPSIHVAGTNGKGSTSHFLASILQEAGYKVGLYTSPHLIDFRERIKINGHMISEEYVVDFVDRYFHKMEDIRPSFFEWTVGLAFTYFAESEVDIAVIETGLGGRLDSTNVITPILSVITNIGLDHTQFLGNTLPEIASEKAGIIKLGVPVVIGETQLKTEDVFRKKASEMKSPIVFADQLHRVIDGSHLIGYQQKNIQTVAHCIPIIMDSGFVIGMEDIQNGVGRMVANTGLRGRWEKLGDRPLVIADTGHNREGLTYTMEQLRTMSYAHLRIVFGMVNDKDPSGVLEILPQEATYYLCQPSIERAMPIDELEKWFLESSFTTKKFPSVEMARDAAIADSQGDDVVFIGGSTFVVADALKKD
jgi:dihydrofolate synthase/folylpolyglutamate synthase